MVWPTRRAPTAAFSASGSWPGTPGNAYCCHEAVSARAAASNTAGLIAVPRSLATASGAAPDRALLTWSWNSQGREASNSASASASASSNSRRGSHREPYASTYHDTSIWFVAFQNRSRGAPGRSSRLMEPGEYWYRSPASQCTPNGTAATDTVDANAPGCPSIQSRNGRQTALACSPARSTACIPNSAELSPDSVICSPQLSLHRLGRNRASSVSRRRNSASPLARIVPRTVLSVPGIGEVRIVSLVTTPNVPPPPPRRAQNRSACCASFATTISPDASTTSASRMLPAAVP